MKWLLTGLTVLTVFWLSSGTLLADPHGGRGIDQGGRGAATHSRGYSGGVTVTQPFVGVNPRYQRFDRDDHFGLRYPRQYYYSPSPNYYYSNPYYYPPGTYYYPGSGLYFRFQW